MLSASLNKTFPSFLPSNSHTGTDILNEKMYLPYTQIFSQLKYAAKFRKHVNDTTNLIMLWFISDQGARCSSVVRAFAHSAMGRRIDPSGVDPLSYFSFQPVLQDWCNKGCGMCYPVCGMVHIKEPLLLIGKSSLCGGSRFPFSLSKWSLTICLTPYNRK